MSKKIFSVAMTEEVAGIASRHLLRKDRQEDLCFALWHPSNGGERMTALIKSLIFPQKSDRNLHGNVSFNPCYLQRSVAEAISAGAGLALLHSHPKGRGWQEMSEPDVRAEMGNAGAVLGSTGFPFVGLTLAGDGAWSARFWERTAPRTYDCAWCSTVRIIGDRLAVGFNGNLMPPPAATGAQIRTVSAWGEELQADLARLKVGVVGAGSVGGFIAESLARTGIQGIVLIDFDSIEEHNLDRLLYATKRDVGRQKVDVLAERLRLASTASEFSVYEVAAAVFEEKGFRAALDCDVLFSCVDRPWGRYVLNVMAYGHLIPVIDGGIAVRTNRHGRLAAADWRAHTATIGRRCLQCLGQYDPAMVQMEREGLLDDSSYIEGLPKDHVLRKRENVFAFSMSCASFQILQMLALVLAPQGLPNPGAQLYHFVGGGLEEPTFGGCHPGCLFPSHVGYGDAWRIAVTGERPE